MTYRALLAEIEYAIGINGSARALAEHWGVSAQYLCDIRKGRRQPGPSILKAMKLKRTTTYTTTYEKQL